MAAPDHLGAQWGANWPEHTTLEHAAHSMDFDTYEGDPAGQRLMKKMVPIHSLGVHPLDLPAGQEAEQRMSGIRKGLRHGAADLPPVVPERWLSHQGLRDGHHRLQVAMREGLTHVPAYVPHPL